jgi:hypothetical protein
MSVMRAGLSPVVRDGYACKTKWDLLVPDYRRIADSHNRTGTNKPAYWTMYAAERREQRLLKLYNCQVWKAIHDWFGQRPQMNPPPSVRDLLNPRDQDMLENQNETQNNDEDP